MVSKVISNSDESAATVTREDGTPFPYAAITTNDTIVADTATEILGHLLKGYAELSGTDDEHSQAFLARHDAAVHLANQAQGLVLATSTQEGTFDPQDHSQFELDALMSDRGTFTDWPKHWAYEGAPLIVVTTSFVPYTDVHLPTGNVTFIDPSTERSLLLSLDAIGVLELFDGEERAA